jgi:hypothetical protein
MEDLTKTITYHYIQGNNIFETDEDRNNFIKYCEYMMFSNYDDPHPIPDDDCKYYFRGLYKAVEMMYEGDILESMYIKIEEEKEEKVINEMKYYEDYYNSEDYYEDLYSQYYFGEKTN